MTLCGSKGLNSSFFNHFEIQLYLHQSIVYWNQIYPRIQNHCFDKADSQLMKGLSAVEKVVRILFSRSEVRKNLRLFVATYLMVNHATSSTIDS